MKIIQTIAGFGAKSGGTSTCTYDLLKALQGLNCNTELLTPNVKNPTDSLMGKGEEWIKVVENDNISPYGYSRNIRQALLASDYDIYHTNGLWMHCNHITCSIAARSGI